MKDEFRQLVIERLRRGEDLPVEWARELFPPEKREYELIYYGKEREEDIIAETMAVPLQPVRTFVKNADGLNETLVSNSLNENSDEQWRNMLILGDNLQVLKTLLEMKNTGLLCNADGTPGIRLIYIDPPFATKQDFHGNQAEKAYRDKISGAEFIEFLRKRLVMLHELLATDGSIFVHLDQRKVHYVKVILDEVLKEHNFRNEIGWRYSGWNKRLLNAFEKRRDSILFYGKGSNQKFNSYSEPWKSTEQYVQIRKQKVLVDEDNREYVLSDAGNGRRVKRYLQEAIQEGRVVDDTWYIDKINNSSKESINYPTQKPEALLERIITAASDEGDIVLDAFAGSGTTLTVAEKLGRRWVGVDIGKLSIYTVQKRMLNLRKGIGNKGNLIQPKPFTLYNAGLYDFSTLKQLPWKDWRFFALQLFGCKDEPHNVGGLHLDGKYRGASVLVFNHLEHPGKRIDEETIQSIHAAVGDKVGRKFHIIAPRGVFDFQQDYIDLGDVRYYAMRIPYSFINELHHREFTALQQPQDENAVNDLIDSIGFDFIRPPKVEWSVGVRTDTGLFKEVFLQVKKFESYVRLRGGDVYGGLETFSMLMFDFDYDGDVFDLDIFFYGHQLEEKNWEARFPVEKVQAGKKVMAVFIDIHGNEAREIITYDQFGI